MLQLRQQALDNLREAALARQRAEKANQAKSELLAIATHDARVATLLAPQLPSQTSLQALRLLRSSL